MPSKGDFQFIGLPDSQLQDLERIAFLSASVPKIVRVFEELKVLRDFHDQIDRIAAKAGVSESDASAIIHILFRMISLRASLNVDSNRLFDILTHNIESQATKTWMGKNFQKWMESQKYLIDALKIDGAMSVTHKALFVIASHQYVLRDSRIITDIRPIFDTEGNAILGSVLTHTLILNYLDGNDLKHMHFTLDASDIARLRELCERAENKVQAIRNVAGTSLGDMIIVGEGKK